MRARDQKRTAAVTIRDLPLSERPLERMQADGVRAVSDADLLAIVLRSGKAGQNALQTAHLILKGRGFSEGRDFLATADSSDLMALSGVGKVKAHQILAAIELGRRVHSARRSLQPLLNTPELVWSYLHDDLRSCEQEEMRVLLLDVKNKLLRMEKVSQGGLSSMVIQPREIMRAAVRANAASFIMVHNHPSGDPTASEQDLSSTIKMREAGKMMGIPLQDHLIFGRERYCSLRQSSHIWET